MSRTFVFAGASSHIAIATANILRAEGNKVIGISRQPQHEGYDEWFSIPQYDFAHFPAIDTPIDGLVYFPGTINLKPFARLTRQEFLHDYEVSALGAAAFVQQYLSHIKKSKAGAIVFVSTVAVQMGMPFHASVAMAKGALEALTRTLAAELAPAIRVNAVAPSLTKTPLSERFLSTPEKTDSAEKRNPMSKVGSPQDVAASITFLLSDQAAWITGQVLAVDGGMGNIKNI